MEATGLDLLLEYFSLEDQKLLRSLPRLFRDRLQELRVRAGRPVTLISGGEIGFLRRNGGISRYPEPGCRVLEAGEAELLFRRFCRDSVHSCQEQIRRGFLSLRGGNRVGLCGQAVLEQGNLFTMREIGSFNIRIAREVKGAAEGILPYFYGQQTLPSVLLAGAPGTGKTTLLRDLARMISGGRLGRFYQVSLIDERGELAACEHGVPQYDVGPCTDVYHLCPKGEGMQMAVRSGGPQLLVCDEIGGEDDVHALLEAMHAGVPVLASAHGDSLKQLRSRPGIRILLDSGAFQQLVLLQTGGRPGQIDAVVPLQHQLLEWKEGERI